MTIRRSVIGSRPAGHRARNVLHGDYVVILEDHRALNYIPQFAHITGPVILAKSPGHFGRDSGNAFAQPLSERLDVKLGERQHIVTACAQAGNVDLNYREAIVKIEPETSGFTLAFQVAV